MTPAFTEKSGVFNFTRSLPRNRRFLKQPYTHSTFRLMGVNLVTMPASFTMKWLILGFSGILVAQSAWAGTTKSFPINAISVHGCFTDKGLFAFSGLKLDLSSGKSEKHLFLSVQALNPRVDPEGQFLLTNMDGGPPLLLGRVMPEKIPGLLEHPDGLPEQCGLLRLPGGGFGETLRITRASAGPFERLFGSKLWIDPNRYWIELNQGETSYGIYCHFKLRDGFERATCSLALAQALGDSRGVYEGAATSDRTVKFSEIEYGLTRSNPHGIPASSAQ